MHKVKLIQNPSQEGFEKALEEFLNGEDIREDRLEICLISYSFGSQTFGNSYTQAPQTTYPPGSTVPTTYQPPPTFQISDQPIYSALIVLRER